MTQQATPKNCSDTPPQAIAPDIDPDHNADEIELPTDAQLHLLFVMSMTSIAQRRAAGEDLPTAAYLISSSDDGTPPATASSSASMSMGPAVLHEAPATAESDVFFSDMKTGTKRTARDENEQPRETQKTKALRMDMRSRPDQAKRPAEDGLQQTNNKNLRQSLHDQSSQFQRGQEDGSVLTARVVKAQKKKRELEAKQYAAAQGHSEIQSAPASKSFEFTYPVKMIGHPEHTFGHAQPFVEPSQQAVAPAQTFFRSASTRAQHRPVFAHPGHASQPVQTGQSTARVAQKRRRTFVVPRTPQASEPEPARAEVALSAFVWDRKGKGKAKEPDASPEDTALAGLIDLGRALPEPTPLIARHDCHYAPPPYGVAGPSTYRQRSLEAFPVYRATSAPRIGDYGTHNVYHGYR